MKARYGKKPEDVLEKIRESFLFELDTPTSDVKGEFSASNH
jgi:hypothetical protein